MAVLAKLVGAGVVASKYLVVPALVFIMWRQVASPLTVTILAAAVVGVSYTTLVKPGEELETWEKGGVILAGLFAGGILQRNRYKLTGGM